MGKVSMITPEEAKTEGKSHFQVLEQCHLVWENSKPKARKISRSTTQEMPSRHGALSNNWRVRQGHEIGRLRYPTSVQASWLEHAVHRAVERTAFRCIFRIPDSSTSTMCLLCPQRNINQSQQ